MRAAVILSLKLVELQVSFDSTRSPARSQPPGGKIEICGDCSGIFSLGTNENLNLQ